MAAQMPSARLRSSPSSKTTVSSDRAAGDMSAPPRPCTRRATMSRPRLPASPPSSEATANSTAPKRKTVRRPSRSAELAAEQQEAAEGEGVAGDDPRQVVLAGDVEGAGDVGQGDVHDRRVEHDHELADREHEQGHALVHLATVGVQGSRPGSRGGGGHEACSFAVFGSTTVDR
jgi:hypothetical protein